MRTRFALVLVGVLGCTKSGPSSVDKVDPGVPSQPEAEPDNKPAVEPDSEPDSEPDGEPVASAITVQMTAATLADDCGGGPNTAPKVKAKGTSAAKHKRSDEAEGRSMRKAKRRCEQSSIQLAIVAPAGIEPAEVAVKSVELMLESGTSIGMLEARAPSIWSDGDGYMPWNQRVEPGQELSVSYAVSQPDWSKVEDRWNQTYTVKAVLSVAGDDQTVQQSVEVDAPTSLPPNVKT